MIILRMFTMKDPKTPKPLDYEWFYLNFRN